MNENSSDSEYSDSSGSTTSSSSSSNASNESAEIKTDTTEFAKIEKQLLQLPSGLCENPIIFEEFFSMNMWESLPSNFQAYLKSKYLPDFSECNKIEQEKSLHMLFNNEITRFQHSPLIDLQKNLEEGNYRPDVLKLRESIKKSKRREERFQKYERISQLAKDLMISREKFLRSAYDAPPGTVLKIDQIINSAPKLDNTAAAVRARKRFYEEMISIAPHINLKDLSEDESYIEDVKPNMINQMNSNNEVKIIGTMCRRKNNNFIAPNYNLAILNNNNLKQMLRAHKRRKIEEPDRPEFETGDVRLRDVHARTQNSNGYKKSNVGRPLGRKSYTKAIKQEQIENLEFTGQSIMTAGSGELNLTQNQLYTNTNISNQQPILVSTNNHISSVGQMKVENSSDSEENVDIKNVVPLPPPIPPLSTLSNLKENSKMQNSIQIPHNNYKGSRKMKLTFNGVTVPETMQNTINSNAKDQQNTELVALHQYGKVKAATLSDLEGIDMMHIPVDLDDSGNIDLLGDLKQKSHEISRSELMQQTHVCFLSLIRDIFCSTPNHRIKLDDLKEKISSWLSNPIAALNDWYCLSDNWLALVPSVIHFLTGEFVEQPEDFVPYIEFKLNLNIYQWIGAGRDSDQRLLQLCTYWLNRRNDMGSKLSQKSEIISKKLTEYEESFSNEQPISPPPPRCPTSWVVKPATPEDLEIFRKQERQRFENPHKSFTYKMHGYESIVGPVKGVYTQMHSVTKARGHNTLIQDRPNFVTILTLVRDATARLPNGEGTRADICELLKSSQYISSDAQESVIQTIVSGALDRMHTEIDPCVKYDTKRKIWIYLHRNRTEEEFERIHQETQNLSKSKKLSSRKTKSKTAKIMQLKSPDKTSLQSVAQSSSITKTTMTGVITNSPAIKLSPTVPHKTPISASKLPINKEVDVTDAEAAIDAQSSPAILQKPQSLIPAQISPALTNELKSPKTSTKKTLQTIISPNPSIPFSDVSKPLGIINSPTNQMQTSAHNKQLATHQNATIIGQTSVVSGNQNQININTTNKNVANPVLVQCQNQPTISSVGQSTGQGFIVPVNINNPEQIKQTLPSVTPSLTSNSPNKKLIKSNQTINTNRSPIIQQSGKNFVRIATATAQSGKSLLNPQIAAANISLQQQKILANSTITTSPGIGSGQQKILPSISSPTGTNSKTQKSIQIISNTSATKSNQPITVNSQQKQILQNLITQQKQQRQQNTISISQNAVVVPSGINQIASIQQNKPVILTSSPANNIQTHQQQQVHKILTPTSAATVSISAGTTQNQTNTINNTIVNISNQQNTANLINPQIIQIHQTAGSQTQIGKMQTINALTAQNLLQSIKQQQLKMQQNQNLNQQQQPIILKQQPTIFQQIQKSSQTTPTTISVSLGGSSPKNVTSLIGTNISNLIATSTGNVVQQSPQNIIKPTITRVIKSGSSIIQPQAITSVSGTTIKTQGASPVMAKVLTNPSGQIISLENLLQKQGIAPGTTLRVTGAKPAQTNLIQLASPPGSQITQYAVVSQGRNLISLGTPQRMITTQASNASNVVTSLGGTIVKVNDQKATTSAVNSPTIQNQPKIITANQIQSLTAQQLVNAKVLSKTGTTGIRMVNASNLNIAHIRGKPVIIASKPTNVTNQQNTQNVLVQNPSNNANIVVGGQTLKVQGNILSPANVQVINQPSSQSQPFVLGNQILKVQTSPQTIKQAGVSTTSNISNSSNATSIGNSSIGTITTMSNINTTSNIVVNTNSNLNQSIPKTVVLGSTGQTIRVQSPQVHVQSGTGISNAQGQSMILGTTVKGTPIKSNSQGQQRVVLAVQGGSQILLPQSFQSGGFNLKSLQGLKVVSIASGQQNQQQQQQQQHQQQNKGEQFRIVTTST